MIVSYVITQANAKMLLPMLHAVSDFISDQIYEESAPMATFESAMRVIQFEFDDANTIQLEETLDSRSQRLTIAISHREEI